MLKNSFFKISSWIILLSGNVLLLYIWLGRHQEITPKPGNPTVYVTNISAWQTNQEGQVTLKLLSPYAQYHDNNSIEFSQPVITIFSQQSDKANWHISAKSGQALNGSRHLILQDNVKAYQPATSKQVATTITTKLANIYLDNQLISSNQPTTMEQIGLSIQGTAVKYYIDGDTQVENPTIELYKPDNKIDWHISAKSGEAMQGNQHIILSGNVKAFHPADNQQLVTTITTELANLYPQQNYLTTYEMATLEQAGLKIQSVGVKANLKTHRIELLQQAKAEYNPTIPNKAH